MSAVRRKGTLCHRYPSPQLIYYLSGEMEGVTLCEPIVSLKMNALCFKVLKEASGSENG